MMIRRVAVLVGFACLCAGAFASEFPDWTPPKTTVAKELIEVGQFLLEHGMADPRGGNFAIAKVKLNTAWTTNTHLSDTIGWVKEVEGKKYIVDLVGQRLPVDSIVRELSIQDAVDKALELNAKGFAYANSYSSLLGSTPDTIQGRRPYVRPVPI